MNLVTTGDITDVAHTTGSLCGLSIDRATTIGRSRSGQNVHLEDGAQKNVGAVGAVLPMRQLFR
jgi:hypothetical protein